MGAAGGGGNSSPITETNPWAPTVGMGEDILGMAQDLFDKQGGIEGNWIDFQGPGVNNNMQGAWDKLAESGALTSAGNQMMQTGQQMSGQLGAALEALKKGSQDITTYDVQSTRDDYLKDKEKYLASNDKAIQNQLNKSIASSTNQIYGAAAGQGGVGSSRSQLAVGQASGDLASNAQSLMAQERSKAYDQAMNQANNQLSGNRQAQMAAAQAGLGAVGQGMNYMQQGAGLHNQAIGNQLQAGLNQYQIGMEQAQINYQNAIGAQNAGWQNLGMLNNLVSGWTSAGCTSQVKDPSGGGGGGKGNSTLGTIGSIAGGVLGGIYGGGPAGAQAGAALGGGLGNMFG